MVHLTRRKIKSREVFPTNMCCFYGHCPYRGKKGGAGSAKRNSVHYFREGRLREVRMISEVKAYFFVGKISPSHTFSVLRSFSFLTLSLLSSCCIFFIWDKEIIDIMLVHIFYLEVDGNVSCYDCDGWYREHHDVHHHLWTFALQFSMWSFVIRHCIVSIVY